MQKMIDGIELRQLKKNVDERGYLCEILRQDWDVFKQFTMAYFSVTYPGVVRAWHRHLRTKQRDYMCFIQGTAKVAIYDDREGSPTMGSINEFIIGTDNITLIKIPGECWHGFKALGIEPTILVNLPDKLYDYQKPDEERLPPDTNKIPYDWQLAPWLKHG